MHGEGDQTMYNEPKFGYGDSSYTDFIIGYGSIGLVDDTNCGYIKGLTDSPVFLGINSEITKTVYKTNIIDELTDIPNTKWMYVPDSCQIGHQHGPYSNSVEASIYLRWQKTIIKLFPKLIYKKHPKGDPVFRKMTYEQLYSLIGIEENDIDIIEDNFSEVYNNCDAYIFDTVSTAFMIAAATSKPIIYFNIDKRNFTYYAESLIKKRCYWIDVMNEECIDLNLIRNTIQKQSCVNKITEAYSLTNDTSQSLDKTLLSLLNKKL